MKGEKFIAAGRQEHLRKVQREIDFSPLIFQKFGVSIIPLQKPG